MRTDKPAPTTVDEYLSNVPEPARSTLETVRTRIRELVPPDATEVLSYGMPAFKWKKPLVGYAAFSNHCSFFPMSAALIASMEEELRNYSTAKGTIRFPSDQPLDTAIITKLVQARLEQVAAKRK